MLDKKRIIIGTFLAIVITLLFLLIPASNIFCLIILSSICAIGVWEFYSLLIAGEIPSSKKLGTFISIIFCIATWYYMHSCKNLIYKSTNNENTKENTKDVRINAIKRIAYQRNFLKEGIFGASNNDLIFYSDNDEIPKLNDANLDKIQNKLIFFKQKLFYYKFNLFCNRYNWHGTKGCKKKDMIDFE